MRRVEVEEWAFRIVSSVLAGSSVEDDHAELKADFVDQIKAARRIAGHLNAAFGEPVLWVIGVDEKAQQLTNPEGEFLPWWEGVRKNFQGGYPEVQLIETKYQNQRLCLALFDSTSAPFVVRNPLHGTNGNVVESEVPWRETTAIRSARRDDLIRMLVPNLRLPNVEVIHGTAEFVREDDKIKAEISLLVYVELSGVETVYIPEHKTSLVINTSDSEWQLEFSEPRFMSTQTYYTSSSAEAGRIFGVTGRVDGKTQLAWSGAGQFIIEAPGTVRVRSKATMELLGLPEPPPEVLHATLSFWVSGANKPKRVRVDLQLGETDKALAFHYQL